jgi:hypothetical protein
MRQLLCHTSALKCSLTRSLAHTAAELVTLRFVVQSWPRNGVHM